MFWTHVFQSRTLVLYFHYIGSLFGPFRDDASHFAAQWKCCWIDPAPFLFPFGAIQSDDKDCLLRLHINFQIKSVASYWIEVVNMKFMEKYIKSRSIVKKWGLKNIKTKKYSCWLTKIKMSGKSSPELQWTGDDPEIQLKNYTDCLLKRLLH